MVVDALGLLHLARICSHITPALHVTAAYRALYIPNWIWRYFAEGYFDLIPLLAGIVQTVLYSDFFYIYYTKYVPVS